MKLISKDEYLLLKEEMREYVNFCNESNYIPSKSDFDDIIEFTLTSEDSMSNLYESYETNSNFIVESLYDSFELNEVKFKGEVEYDNKKDFDAAVKGVGVAALAAGAAAVGVGAWIHYLFKKRKVRKLVAEQTELNVSKIKEYGNLISMQNKLAELEGGEPSSTEWPSYS
jgi:hypothetical protein